MKDTHLGLSHPRHGFGLINNHSNYQTYGYSFGEKTLDNISPALNKTWFRFRKDGCKPHYITWQTLRYKHEGC